MQEGRARLDEDSSAPASARPASGLAAGAVYRSRRSILDKDTAWRLTADSLERAGEGRPAFAIPYAEITEVRLSYDPTRFEADRRRCDILSRRSGRVMIASVSFLSPMNFENRGADYVPFVPSLVGNVAAKNPACRFLAGKKPFAYLAEHLFLLAVQLLLVSVLYVTGVPVAGVVAIKLGLIAAYVPIMLRYARANRPREFDPADIPADVLPAA